MKKSKFDIYTNEEIEILRAGGKILHDLLRDFQKEFVPGRTTGEIDKMVEKAILDKGCIPVFKNYTPFGAGYPYPASSCISINEEVTHGIPGDRVIQDGDLVAFDVGIKYQGFVLDSAISFGVGNITDKEKKLIQVGEAALDVAISQIKSGVRTRVIGVATDKFVRSSGFRVSADLCGHGVGRKIHSEPIIPHIDIGEKGDLLEEGMVIAIEPHVSMGSGDIILKKGNDYTCYAKDGAKAVQFEHTVLVTKDGFEVLT